MILLICPTFAPVLNPVSISQMLEYTPQFLKKIEEVFEENAYKIRYEKGNFKSGYCIIEDRKMVVVNRFASTESRIITLLEILRVLSAGNQVEGEKFAQIRKQLDKQADKQQSLEEAAE